MAEYEVPNPIICSPFEEPTQHWYIQEGAPPELREGRRCAVVFPPSSQKSRWTREPGILEESATYSAGYDLALVNLIRERLQAWRESGYEGATGVSLELLRYWRREGREKRLFFAQLEAAETVIFLAEARGDFLQGVQVPRDEPSEERKAQGYAGFQRQAVKMATGAGKSTVMAMLAAWSILNKANNRQDSRFSDVVLIVCPNVTIRDRLRELSPHEGEASIYRTRDLVPSHLMPSLTQGKVIVTNWHVFEPQVSQAGGESARVVKTGVPTPTQESVIIGDKTTVARGRRYMTEEDLQRQVAAGVLSVVKEERHKDGRLKRVSVSSTRYVESDTALVNRILRGVGGKKNILVMNDEAHHAYRIAREQPDGAGDEDDLFGEDEEADEFFREATVWVSGLDKLSRVRGINRCIDLSATPYFLGRVGQEVNKPFPWVVSDFGLIDSIESGLVKIPQLAIRDTTGAAIPGYFNIWRWVLDKLTPAERGARQASPKPEAILKYAHSPIAMLGALWAEAVKQHLASHDDTRPPVFILVCKNTAIAKVIYEWLGEDKRPAGIPSVGVPTFRNADGQVNTIRVDSKVIHETDTDGNKGDESRWMRFTLDTVGKQAWAADELGRPLYPEGFEELASRLGRPLHPPGRDVRCIVSVAMLTEGWDCNTVQFIIGLRPFMSQLLCEQVVGRGLRRTTYALGDDGLFSEEVAKVFGVPFEVIPFKANPDGVPPKPEKRHHVCAVPARAEFRLTFPRVEGYSHSIRSRVTVDWETIPPLTLDPGNIPPEVQVKGLSITNEGRLSLSGPGAGETVDFNPLRRSRRLQNIVFELATTLTKEYASQGRSQIPTHVLFQQMLAICRRYVDEKVRTAPATDKKDVACSPYFGWVVETLVEGIRPDTEHGEEVELPRYESLRQEGSTSEVSYYTSKPVYEIHKSHVNYVVADTKTWEQSAAYYLDTSPHVHSFAKNAGLGFGIPYFYNGQKHEFVPDFIIRLATDPQVRLVLEIKGGREPEEQVKAKESAAERWVRAVTEEGSHGRWLYRTVRDPKLVPAVLEEVRRAL